MLGGSWPRRTARHFEHQPHPIETPRVVDLTAVVGFLDCAIDHRLILAAGARELFTARPVSDEGFTNQDRAACTNPHRRIWCALRPRPIRRDRSTRAPRCTRCRRPPHLIPKGYRAAHLRFLRSSSALKPGKFARLGRWCAPYQWAASRTYQTHDHDATPWHCINCYSHITAGWAVKPTSARAHLQRRPAAPRLWSDCHRACAQSIAGRSPGALSPLELWGVHRLTVGFAVTAATTSRTYLIGWREPGHALWWGIDLLAAAFNRATRTSVGYHTEGRCCSPGISYHRCDGSDFAIKHGRPAYADPRVFWINSTSRPGSTIAGFTPSIDTELNQSLPEHGRGLSQGLDQRLVSSAAREMPWNLLY